MANVTYDLMWREAMMELLDQLEAENPEDAQLAPKDLAEWACIYIKYLQIFRKLETAYDQLLHPQKRQDVKRALEACMGRMLEIRHWMVHLNRGLDYVHLDDLMVDLKLTPDALEVPVPRYFVEDRSKELEDRQKFLETLLSKYQLSSSSTTSSTAAGTAARGASAATAAAAAAAIDIGAPLPPEEALAVIVRNVQGAQARQRMKVQQSAKKQRLMENKRSQLGIALGQEEAATRIQSCIRGKLNRNHVKREVDNELQFLGMKPKPLFPGHDPQQVEAKNLVARKEQQLVHLEAYDEAVVALKANVKEIEGQDMREAIQDKINAWFIENRNADTGDYPDFPDAEDGGSKLILAPPLPTVEQLLAEDAEGGDGKGKGGKKEDPKKAAAKKGGKDADEPEVREACITSVFIPVIEGALAEYVGKWQERPEGDNLAQTHDVDLIKEELRPLVFEEVRQQVDAEMRVLLANLKEMVEVEKAAKSGKKGKKKKGKKGGKKKGKKGKEKGGKKKKDPTADRSMESLYAELVSNGILVPVPPLHIQDYLGACSYMGATLEKAGIIPDPSLAQVRQVLTEYVVLPLGSQQLHERLPFINTVLLYGAKHTGKTLLTQAVASMTGANFFDLSPRNTDGHYPGKAAAMMLHMVFKVARTMAPAVIYIDEVEKVFVSDKKKSKEFGGQEPFSRIKKDLLKEIKALGPQDRVVVVGNSSEPWLAAKKDEKAFMGFWKKMLLLPLPDYASRRLIWPGLFERHGGRLPYEFDISTLAHVSEGYIAGDLDAVVAGIMATRRTDGRVRGRPVDIPEILQWLSRVQPLSKEMDEALRKWQDRTPAMAAIKGADQPAAAAADAKKGGKADGGKKKK